MSSPTTTKPISTHHDVADLAADLMCSAKKQPAPGNAATAGSTASATEATDVQRAMDSARTWKPSLDRQQSWNKEDQKHELQMSPLSGGRLPGFTEERR